MSFSLAFLLLCGLGSYKFCSALPVALRRSIWFSQRHWKLLMYCHFFCWFWLPWLSPRNWAQLLSSSSTHCLCHQCDRTPQHQRHVQVPTKGSSRSIKDMCKFQQRFIVQHERHVQVLTKVHRVASTSCASSNEGSSRSIKAMCKFQRTLTCPTPPHPTPSISCARSHER